MKRFKSFLAEQALSPEELQQKYYSEIPWIEFEHVAKWDKTSVLKGNVLIRVGKWTKQILDLYKKDRGTPIGNALKIVTMYQHFQSELKPLNKYNTFKEIEMHIDKLHPEEQVGELSMTQLNSKLAAIWWGKGSEWCTAPKKGSYYDSNYSKKHGDLYYIASNKEIFQFFISKDKELSEIKDWSDQEVDIWNMIEEFPEFKGWYDKKTKSDNVFVEFKGRRIAYHIEQKHLVFRNLYLDDINDMKSLKEFVAKFPPGFTNYRVLEEFSCSGNNLTDLQGAPSSVDGGFDVSWNKKLKSLKGAPKQVLGDFKCDCCALTSLEGISDHIGFELLAYENNIKNLKGLKYVGIGIHVSQNPLTSLKGIPKNFKGTITCSDTKIKSLEGVPRQLSSLSLESVIHLESLKGIPKIIDNIFLISNAPKLKNKYTVEDVENMTKCKYVRFNP